MYILYRYYSIKSYFHFLFFVFLKLLFLFSSVVEVHLLKYTFEILVLYLSNIIHTTLYLMLGGNVILFTPFINSDFDTQYRKRV